MKFTPKDLAGVLFISVLISVSDYCFHITVSPRQLLIKFIVNIVIALIVRSIVKTTIPPPKRNQG
jgi:hypothetical protein